MATVRPQSVDLAPDGPSAPAPSRPPLRRRRGLLLAAAVVALLVVVAGIAYWLHARNRVSTDDAFIEARIIQISPKVGGQVVELNVTDNQRVRAGEVLLRIDPRDYGAAAEQARAQVRAAEVEAQRARTDAQRVSALFARGLVAPAEIRVDAYRGHKFRGHVDSIQAGTGSRFSLLPPENATGNYVKVVQRVPVKIVFDEPPDPAFPIGPGMSVV